MIELFLCSTVTACVVLIFTKGGRVEEWCMRAFAVLLAACAVLSIIALTSQFMEAAEGDSVPVIPNASMTVIDTTAPKALVQPSAWAWPKCDETGVTIELLQGTKDYTTNPQWRKVLWRLTDAAGNQTFVARSEYTYVTECPHPAATFPEYTSQATGQYTVPVPGETP